MEDISALFNRFKKILFAQEKVKEVVSKLLLERTGAHILKKDIVLKNNTAYISTTPLIKNEILLQKKTLLHLIEEKQLPILIRDIN